MYLALIEVKQAPVKLISKLAEIDRSEVYRAISGLEKFGLIEKIISKPTEYRSVELQIIVPLLIKHRKKDLNDLENRANELIENSKKQTFSRLGDDILLFSPKTEPVVGRINDIIARTEKTADILTTAERFLMSGVNSPINAKYRNGVRHRLLSEKPVRKGTPRISPNTDFRVTTETVAAPMAIHDRKEAMVFISETTDFDDAAMFYTNNPRLVKIFCAYFDNLWRHSKEPISDFQL